MSREIIIEELISADEGSAGELVLRGFEINDYQYEEAMKTLRTNIQFSGSNIHTVMFTSTVPNEGKSETTFQLAVSMAQLGKKVLLVDADIRKSVLVSRYHLEHQVDGLSQYLSGQSKREEVIYRTNIPNLNIIFSGPFSPNPAELLEGELFAGLLAWAKESYDYILIDSPPMGSVIDGAVISRHCDGAILVIESGAISYRLVQKVKNQLEKGGCRILGTVLNKVDLKQGSYYYYGKYGKYYGYGHEDVKQGSGKEASSV